MSNPQTELGAIITDATAQRDAVHIAVAPIVAAETLYPGQRVGLSDTMRASSEFAKLGIVDPFLSGPIYEGQRFWLFLFPNTITGLNHVWTHPAFVEGAAPVISKQDKNTASEEWLRAFADANDCGGYHKMMVAAEEAMDGYCDEYVTIRGSEAHGDIPPEFWTHMENVTGRKMTVTRPTFFSCSC